MGFWQECYDLKREKSLVVPFWLDIFSLMKEFWEEILEGIENEIGDFVKIL